jgi:carbamoylphosphate synthase large subunit
VQFAVSPDEKEIISKRQQPRVRSSALASKATGYQLRASKLALG